MLGQSLDELAPQTRRLLTAVHSYATAEARRLAIPLDLCRFTRRQLREHLAAQGSGWGDTQLKVHLTRLVDLELVIVHRLESGAFGYELAWKPPAVTSTTTGTANGYGHGQRFLAGLTDPRALLVEAANGYDPEPVGPESPIHAYDLKPVGANTPVVGPWSGPGRGPVAPAVGSPPPDPEVAEEGEAVADLRWVSGDG